MGEDVSERRFALDAADEDAVASRKGQKRLDCLAKALSACSRTDTKQDDPQEAARQHLCRTISRGMSGFGCIPGPANSQAKLSQQTTYAGAGLKCGTV